MTEPSPMSRPQPLPDSEVERALVVVAHPDDADYGAAGTLAAWTDAGIEVTLLLCTRGEQGGFDDTPRDQMPAIREAEQRAASAVVGVHDVRFVEGTATAGSSRAGSCNARSCGCCATCARNGC